MFVSKLEDGGIGGLRWEYIAEVQDFVAKFLEELRDELGLGEIFGYVLIEQELHR